MLRGRSIAPHIARIESRDTPSLDAHTTQHDGYAVSQQKAQAKKSSAG